MARVFEKVFSSEDYKEKLRIAAILTFTILYFLKWKKQATCFQNLEITIMVTCLEDVTIIIFMTQIIIFMTCVTQSWNGVKNTLADL